VGYLEMAPIPTALDHTVFVVMGNNENGVLSAARALLNPSQQKHLAEGNFAIVQGAGLTAEQVSAPAEQASSGISPIQVTPVATTTPDATAAAALHKEGWILPVLVCSILIVLGLFAYEVYSTLRKNL
jgi:hypothetical protein